MALMKGRGKFLLLVAIVGFAFLASATNSAPVMTFSVPSPQVVAVGSNLTFAVTVTDSDGDIPDVMITNRPPGFFHFDAALGSGSLTGSFTYIPSTAARWSSPYSVVFVASDGVNPPLSNTMTVVVTPSWAAPLTLAKPFSENGQFYFEILGTGPPNGTIGVVQASTNLINWETIGILGGDHPVDSFTDAAATNSIRRFYRVKQK
jgi:hypothetical protein